MIVSLIRSSLEFGVILAFGIFVTLVAIIIISIVGDEVFRKLIRDLEDPAKRAFNRYIRVLGNLPSYSDWSNVDLSNVKLWETTYEMGSAKHKKILARGISQSEAISRMLESTKDVEVKTIKIEDNAFGRSYKDRTVAVASMFEGSEGNPQLVGSFTRKTLFVFAFRSSYKPALYDLVSYIYEEYKVID